MRPLCGSWGAGGLSMLWEGLLALALVHLHAGGLLVRSDPRPPPCSIPGRIPELVIYGHDGKEVLPCPGGRLQRATAKPLTLLLACS